MGILGMDRRKMHARARTAAPTKTMIQSSVVNCLSQDFIDFWLCFKVCRSGHSPKIAQIWHIISNIDKVLALKAGNGAENGIFVSQ